MRNNSLQVCHATLLADSLDSYMHSINKIPMLSAEEELECSHKWQNSQDIQAAQRLVLAHLRYVVFVARGFMGYGLALNDLIQEGNVGLMKAVKRFDPGKGVRLVTFAMYWIRAEVHEFILRNWRVVKIATTKAQRKLFFNLRSLKKGLGWLSIKERAKIASDLNVKVSEVEHMEQRLGAIDDVFDLTISDACHGKKMLAPEEYLVIDNNPAKHAEHTNWMGNVQRVLRHALLKLDLRGRDIIHSRWLQDKRATLKDLSEVHGVSLERIRQLEKRAIKSLRQELIKYNYMHV